MPISVENISFVYQKGTPFERKALKGVSFTIDDGEVLGIIGPTGSGKSTLLQMLNGLLQPSAGRIVVDDREISCLKKRELSRLRQEVGLIFQYPEEQIFESRVYDEVAFAARNMGLASQEIEERVKDAFQNAGLSYDAFKNRRTDSLSSGEKRRVAIASILVLKPRYLLLDEPTAGLDFEGRRALLDCLLSLNQAGRTTVVIVSHDLTYLVRVCKRFILLKDGNILLDGDISVLLEHYGDFKEQGMELPAAYELIYKLNLRKWGLEPYIKKPEEAVRVIAERIGTGQKKQEPESTN
ncbi:MAG: energy-coupling factor transporter ATPase [Syntrophomonadaceae bacterium]|nr:energy-coupling factor transporter ATPase [Syntrophomonadaceae bacterium]